MTATEIDTTQFNNTPVIRKLSEKTDKKSRRRTKSTDGEQISRSESSCETSNRGRKRKYNTDEERLEARRLQQRQYRERKKAELVALKSNKIDA